MRRLASPLLLAVLSLATADAVAAQTNMRDEQQAGYRDGEPAVLAPRPSGTGPDMRLVNFRAAYARAKAPRMMLMWNTSFTDEATSSYVDRTTMSAESERNFTYTGEQRRSSAVIESGRSRITRGQNPVLSRQSDTMVRAAFNRQLVANGVQVVDRTMAIRTARGAKSVAADGNMQALETEALTTRARILIEVEQIDPDNGGPVQFHVVAKDVQRATVLADFVSDGMPPPQRLRLVPGATGFERETPAAIPINRIGTELANRMMAELGGQLK